MGFSIGFGVGPIRYSTRLSAGRRKKSSGDGAAVLLLVLGAALVAVAAAAVFTVFLVSVAIAPLAGLIAGSCTKPRTPRATARRYTAATTKAFAELLKKATT
jgi:hypothetical protein